MRTIMGAIHHLASYVDRKAPSVLYRAETVILLGTVTAITEIFLKAIFFFVSLMTERHRGSSLVNYIEGKNIFECIYLLEPFWKRRRVIEDRQGPRNFDKDNLIVHPKCRELEIFAGFWNSLKDDPSFIHKAFLHGFFEKCLEDFKPHLQDPDKLIELIKIDPKILGRLERSMLGDEFDVPSFIEKIELLDKSLDEDKKESLWVELIVLFPDQKIFEKIERLLKESRKFIDTMCYRLKKTPEGDDELCRLVRLQPDILWNIGSWSKKKDPAFIFDCLDRGINFAKIYGYWTAKTMEKLLLAMEDWTGDKEKCIKQMIRNETKALFEGLKRLEESGKIVKMEAEEYEEWKQKDLGFSSHLAALYYALKNDPVFFVTAYPYGITDIYPYLSEQWRRPFPQDVEKEQAVVDFHLKLVLGYHDAWKGLDPSWKNQTFVNMLVAGVNNETSYDFCNYLELIVDWNVDFFIEAVTVNFQHLLTVKWYQRWENASLDTNVQKIIKAMSSPEKNQYQQLAMCGLLMKKFNKEPGIFIKNLDLLIKDGTIPKMGVNEFFDWKENNALFYEGIFRRNSFDKLFSFVSNELKEYDCSSLKDLKANTNNLAAIHYGFTQDQFWMNEIFMVSSCFPTSISAIYPYFSDYLKKSWSVKCVTLDHKVLQRLDPSVKTKDFFQKIFNCWELSAEKLKDKFKEFAYEQQLKVFEVLKKDEPLYFMSLRERDKKVSLKGRLLRTLDTRVRGAVEWSKNKEKMLELTTENPHCLQYAYEELLDDDDFILDIPQKERIIGIFQAEVGFLGECRKTAMVFLLCKKKIQAQFKCIIPNVLMRKIIGCMLLSASKSGDLWALKK